MAWNWALSLNVTQPRVVLRHNISVVRKPFGIFLLCCLFLVKMVPWYWNVPSEKSGPKLELTRQSLSQLQELHICPSYFSEQDPENPWVPSTHFFLVSLEFSVFVLGLGWVDSRNESHVSRACFKTPKTRFWLLFSYFSSIMTFLWIIVPHDLLVCGGRT